MEGKNALMLRVLMNRYNQTSPDIFLAGLNKNDAQLVMKLPASSQEPAKAIVMPLELLSGDTIHYSWLAPALGELPLEIRALAISALPKTIGERLSNLTSTKLVDPPSVPVKHYVAQLLYQKLNAKDVIPEGFLPNSPLMPLLNFRKLDLIVLIDYLGIFDLAQELRQVVDKEVVNGVYKSLSPKMLSFLRICLHQKDRVKVAKIGLKNWRGDSDKLLRVVHRRGLQRLGGALSGQHPDLLWYISRRLDRGRGHLLLTSYNKKEIPQVTAALIQQVLNVINFINKTSEA